MRADREIKAVAIDKVIALLDLPRPWGTTNSKGRWYRRKRNDRPDILTPEAFRREIGKKPIMISISNYGGNAFTNIQPFAIFDFDNSEDPNAAKDPLKIISETLNELKIDILHSDSGGKGYHTWVFFTKPLHTKDVEKFQDAVLERSAERINIYDDEGYVRAGFLKLPGDEKWGYFTEGKPYDKDRILKEQEYTEIEFLTSLGEGKMIKSLLSRHPKQKNRFEIPMTIEDVITHDRTKPPSAENFRKAERLTLLRYLLGHYQKIQ